MTHPACPERHAEFLTSAGWTLAHYAPLPADASTRSYARVTRADGLQALLMDAPSHAEAPIAAPNADEASRTALGYAAQARLAGNNVVAFAGLAQMLTQRGFSAPRIYHGDLENGFLLIEDFGNRLFASDISSDPSLEPLLYERAVDTLAALARSTPPATVEAFGARWPIMAYDRLAYETEIGLLLDWYVPHRTGRPMEPDLRNAFLALWPILLESLGPPRALVLRDVHAQNLLYLPDRDPIASVGLIDFQDALIGHPAYDLVSLLEDARRDVDRALITPLTDRFIDRAGIADGDTFRAGYALLGAQRNAKILGIFVRLAKRDGKTRYLDLLPRVEAHFSRNLSHPLLAPVRDWLKDAGVFPGV